MKVRFLIFNSPFLFSRTSDAIITGCMNPKKQPYLMRERIPNKNPPARKNYSLLVLSRPSSAGDIRQPAYQNTVHTNEGNTHAEIQG